MWKDGKKKKIPALLHEQESPMTDKVMFSKTLLSSPNTIKFSRVASLKISSKQPPQINTLRRELLKQMKMNGRAHKFWLLSIQASSALWKSLTHGRIRMQLTLGNFSLFVYILSSSLFRKKLPSIRIIEMIWRRESEILISRANSSPM